MEKRMVLLLVAVIVPAVIAASACAGAAPTPTTAPAKPAATTAPGATAAPTKPAASPTTAATSAPTATSAPAATKPAASPAATSPAGGTPTPAGGNVAAGQTVFQQSCNSCHPNGNAGVGPALRGKNLSADRITTQVRNGGGGMPAFSSSQIGDQQLNDLVAYVQSLK